jgi:chemotaxis protein methyltransferase CheR
MAVQVSETEAAIRDAELERLELELLLEAIHRRYGFDFRGYAPASLKRRIRQRVVAEGADSVSGLQERVLHDPEAMERLLDSLSITVTSMFRDPGFFTAFREQIVPLLRTYPFARIWNPGCSTGEESWSLAIMLAEAGLADRVRIYATDINENVVERARAGVFALDKMQEYTRNYIRAGGTRAFSEYYVAAYDGARFQRSLGDGIVFAQHNLVSDRSFNEFHAIVCRNVLIYFGRPLQETVLELFHDSLAMFGILVLGQKETIRFTRFADSYEELDAGERIYRKVA